VSSYWFQLLLEPLKDHLEKHPEDNKRASAVLGELIDKDREDTHKKFRTLEALGNGHGEHILERYASELNVLADEMFGSFKPGKEIREALRDTVSLMFTRNLFGDNSSTVVFAGMGEAEALPVLFQYVIGNIVEKITI
jgi:hypothetical protein